MDQTKIGRLIYRLRKENHMTQMQLAHRMNVSDKAVSKWERGLGCPELSLLPELSKIFCVDLEKLLSGELDANEILGGNMRKIRFYICLCCGNVITTMADASLSCCSRKLEALQPQKAENLYPEWELQVRIPVIAHGRLVWYCNQHGLFYMDV